MSYFHKIGITRGVNSLQIRVARGGQIEEEHPWDWINLTKKCRSIEVSICILIHQHQFYQNMPFFPASRPIKTFALSS